MTPELAAILIFGNLVLFLTLGVPVAFALLSVSLIWSLILQGTLILQILPATIYETATTEIYIAAPLFILMAVALEKSGIGALLYEAIYKWTGGIPGGLAIGTVVAATLVAAMTGIGGTAVLVLGILAVPEMIRRGYDVRLAIGGLPPSGALGILIPPTVVGVLLGGFTGIPIGSLFFGGAVPGVLIALLFCLYILVRCALNPALAPAIPKDERPSLLEKLRTTRSIILPLGLIVLVLGVIWTGTATPTEASGIGAFGTLALGIARGSLRWKQLKEVMTSAATVSVMVMTLLIGGAIFSRLLQFSGSARLIADLMIGLEVGPMAMLLIFVVVTTILGMFIDGAAIVFIVSPIMMPIVQMLGIDPVWFGVILMISIAAGYVTPPFGMNLFYLRGIIAQTKDEPGCERLATVTMTDIWMACLPYVVLIYVVIGLVIAFPELATWLPQKLR
ncbi:TRAP transporter large permease [Pararhodobacter oceanensis]|uniref:TRAP transporter large permease n=1 Tax=Pararhodobacter oceanensis TaxID=2172121 RepID=UPI003A9258C0